MVFAPPGTGTAHNLKTQLFLLAEAAAQPQSLHGLKTDEPARSGRNCENAGRRAVLQLSDLIAGKERQRPPQYSKRK